MGNGNCIQTKHCHCSQSYRAPSYALVTTAVLPPNDDNRGFAELLAEEKGGGDQRGGEKPHFDHYGSTEIYALPFSLQ